jgi:hypothetical protein
MLVAPSQHITLSPRHHPTKEVSVLTDANYWHKPSRNLSASLCKPSGGNSRELLQAVHCGPCNLTDAFEASTKHSLPGDTGQMPNTAENAMHRVVGSSRDVADMPCTMIKESPVLSRPRRAKVPWSKHNAWERRSPAKKRCPSPGASGKGRHCGSVKEHSTQRLHGASALGMQAACASPNEACSSIAEKCTERLQYNEVETDRGAKHSDGLSGQGQCASPSSEASALQHSEAGDSEAGLSDADVSAGSPRQLWDSMHPDTQRADRVAALFAEAFAAPMRCLGARCELGLLPQPAVQIWGSSLLDVNPAWVQQEAQTSGDLLLAAHLTGLTEALGLRQQAGHATGVARAPERSSQCCALASVAVARQQATHMHALDSGQGCKAVDAVGVVASHKDSKPHAGQATSAVHT